MDITPAPSTSPAPPPAKPAEVRSQARYLVPLLALCAVGALFWPRAENDAPPGGRVEDRDGGRVELEDRYRQVTLVHFWATWCAPCRDEMPKLQKFAGELSARPDFALLMVAVADDRKKALDFVGGTQGTFFDEGWTVSKSWGSDKLPETHLVVGGRRVHTFIGAQDWDDAAVRAKVQEAFALGKS